MEICPLKDQFNLWESLCRSILEYGSEVWGKEKWPEGEQIQADMAKRILRVSTKTTRSRMVVIAQSKKLQETFFWFHIIHLDDNRLLKKVYIISRTLDKATGWARTIHDILKTCNLLPLWDNP